MKCKSIETRRLRLDGGSMFGHAPKSLWSQWMKCDCDNQITIACRALLVEIEGVRLLFEVGIGDYMSPKHRDKYGVEQVPEDSLDLGSIDYVVLSHLHFDHVGGLMPVWSEGGSVNSAPLFPGAKYVVSKEQFEQANSPHLRDRSSYIEGFCEQIADSGQMLLLSREETFLPEVGPGIEFHYSDGHTRGMLHSLLHGATEKLFLCMDMIPGTAWLHLPITTGYDRFPEKLVDEKAAILRRAYDEQWLLHYYHDPVTAVSRVTLDSKGRYCPGEDPGFEKEFELS